jgi:hypothetical protein
LLLFNALPGAPGKNLLVPINSSISIFNVFGINNNPNDAIKISLKCINSTV